MAKMTFEQLVALRPVARGRRGAKKRPIRGGRVHGREYVYVIGPDCATSLKIGKTVDVFARLDGLRTGSPVELRLVFWIQVEQGMGLQIENLAHKLVSDDLIQRRGEWFCVTPEAAARAVLSAARSLGAEIFDSAGCPGVERSRSDIAQFLLDDVREKTVGLTDHRKRGMS